LDGYSDLILMTRAVSKTGASTRLALRVSTDNGVTFYDTSGDYRSVTDFGTEVLNSGVGFSGLNNTPAYSGVIRINGMNVVSQMKLIINENGSTTASVARETYMFIGDDQPINAVRMTMFSPSGIITGGEFTVLGKR